MNWVSFYHLATCTQKATRMTLVASTFIVKNHDIQTMNFSFFPSSYLHAWFLFNKVFIEDKGLFIINTNSDS